MFERGEIKTAVKKAEKFRKQVQKSHNFAIRSREQAQTIASTAEYKIQEAQIVLDQAITDISTATTEERNDAKKIIALDNLTRKFLRDLDDVETGKKQSIAA